jgi:hypothetical protein
MSCIQTNILAGASGQGGGGYEIERSLRFNSADSAYLNRTPSVAGNRRTWTWSGWYKRTKAQSSLSDVLFSTPLGSSDSTLFNFIFLNDAIYIAGSATGWRLTSAVFRDPSSWYHIVLSIDTTQATANNRIRLYVNGSEITDFSTLNNPSQDADLGVNNTVVHRIGNHSNTYLDGYLADIHFIDGQALAPTDFGETDDNGVWQAKKFAGSFTDTRTIQVGTPSYPSDFTTTGNKTSDQTGLSFSTWSGSYTGAITKIFKVNDTTAFDLTIDLSGGTNDRYLWSSNNGTDWTYVGNVNGLGKPYTLSGSKYYAASEGSGSTTLTAVNPSSGANSFHLDFADNSSNAALGTDTSGVSPANTWTVNNLSVAAGAGNDSLRDYPTNGTQTDTGAGGEVVGNYATWNPLSSSGVTLSNGNLDATNSNSATKIASSTIVPTEKCYWEVTIETPRSGSIGGIHGVNAQGVRPDHSGGAGIYLIDSASGGGTYVNGTKTAAADYSASAGDIIGFAFDPSTRSLIITRNGSSIGTLTAPDTDNLQPVSALNQSVGINVNFGQRAFAYTAPSGYKALCTANLPEPTIADGSLYFDTKLYTGNNGTTSVDYAFSPDFVWIKGRSEILTHRLVDIVRGGDKQLNSNTTGVELSFNGVSFQADGFDVTNDIYEQNKSGTSYVAWAWDAGSSTVTNNDGSIASQVRANPSAGFSIVKWNNGGGGVQNVGHGLNATPEFWISKPIDTSGSWFVYHKSIGTGKYLRLERTDAQVGTLTYWTPTATTMNIATNLVVGTSSNMIAYCFAPVAGYSAMGSYTGNGSTDGPFVFTGFRPAFLMIKRYSTTGSWMILDAGRNPENLVNHKLSPNSSVEEDNNSIVGSGDKNSADFLSNGFKLRSTNGETNGSGDSFLFAAFAEHPFKTARAR